MNNNDYLRLEKILRLKLLDDILISEIVGLMRVGRLSTHATRLGEWDYLLKSVNAHINNIQSNRRTRTGVLLQLSERALLQARAVRDVVADASLCGRTLDSFFATEDDGVTPRNTRVWWTWIPKPERDALRADLEHYYLTCGAKRGKRFTLYRDREYERIIDQSMRRWQERAAVLREQYATRATLNSLYPKSATKKGAFILGLVARALREAHQLAMRGEDIPQSWNKLLPPAIYARSLQARAVPDDHAGMDAMLDIKGFEDFYQP